MKTPQEERIDTIKSNITKAVKSPQNVTKSELAKQYKDDVYYLLRKLADAKRASVKTE